MISQDCQSGLIGKSGRGGAGCPNCPRGPGGPSGPSGQGGTEGKWKEVQYSGSSICIERVKGKAYRVPGGRGVGLQGPRGLRAGPTGPQGLKGHAHKVQRGQGVGLQGLKGPGGQGVGGRRLENSMK